MHTYRLIGPVVSLALAAGPVWAQHKRGANTAVERNGPRSRSWFGELSGPYSPVTESAARAFLAGNAERFGLDPALDGLSLSGSGSTPMGSFFRFEQSYSGVPVYGAEVKVNFNRAGRVVAVNSSYLRGIGLASLTPTLSAERAQEVLRQHVPPGQDEADDPPVLSSRLVVYVSGDGAVLAWRVVRATSGPTWTALVHAGSGRLLTPPRDENRYVNGSGRVFPVNAVVATHDNSLVDNRDAASAVPSSAYTTVVLPGLAGSGFLDGQYASSARTRRRVFNATNSFIFDRSSDGFSETMGYFYLDNAQRYIQTLGFTNVNNRQQVFAVNRLKQDNSFYSLSNREISYGTGGVDDAEDAEVILHEYGHSIQDNQVPGFGSTLEAGSMGEGFSDYWAGTVGAQFSGGFQDTCIAEWDATSYSSTNPPCLRRLDSTKIYPADVAGEVHDDGEIWSAALWQIRGAIGAAQADKAILQHHFLLAPDASFNEAADALVTAAANLGYTPPQVNSIRSILQARGFTVTV